MYGGPQFEKTPRPGQRDGIHPGCQHHDRVAEVRDGRLEGRAPPVEVTDHGAVLVDGEDIEPDNHIWFVSEGVLKRLHDCQELVLPGVGDEDCTI